MQPEDRARYELWRAIEASANADARLRAMTDSEIADLILKVYADKVTFSLEETLLSQIRERLVRANQGPLELV